MSRSFKKNPSFNPFRSGIRKFAKRKANKQIRQNHRSRNFCDNYGYYRKINNGWVYEWRKSWRGSDWIDYKNFLVAMDLAYGSEDFNINDLFKQWQKMYKRK